MGYTITYNHPHFPEGTMFNVGGLDSVPNGGTLEVDEDMERQYILTNGQSLEDGFANDATVSLSGSSSLDSAEVESLISQSPYAPVPEVVEEAPVANEEEKPAWLSTSTPPADEGSEQ